MQDRLEPDGPHPTRPHLDLRQFVHHILEGWTEEEMQEFEQEGEWWVIRDDDFPHPVAIPRSPNYGPDESGTSREDPIIVRD